ncbi:MAG: bifunctional adenosylcobinamide kinase/adenosylcobinamide-phosphate guanylyltransferase [Oscillospiraceae bacterium]|nr:bifunctional adenosylcobinamide kinase/adenosylcobinamide-phosphate guanylyltransferase [Oscillospiraceae bacterium]
MKLLLTGGSACGKSTYAEAAAVRLPLPRYYIAAMRPYGDEGAARVARHRALRADKQFVTIERYTDLAGLRLPSRGTVLLECLCNLTANEMFDADGAGADAAEDAVLRGVRALAAQCDDLIVVTNDVGSDGGGYDAAVMRYVGALGRVNRALAAEFDRVFELCCGIPIPLKGELL